MCYWIGESGTMLCQYNHFAAKEMIAGILFYTDIRWCLEWCFCWIAWQMHVLPQRLICPQLFFKRKKKWLCPCDNFLCCSLKILPNTQYLDLQKSSTATIQCSFWVEFISSKCTASFPRRTAYNGQIESGWQDLKEKSFQIGPEYCLLSSVFYIIKSCRASWYLFYFWSQSQYLHHWCGWAGKS